MPDDTDVVTRLSGDTHYMLMHCFAVIQAAAGEEEDRETNGPGDTATQTGTRTTLNDLYDTLRKLEEEEHFPTHRGDKKTSWCKWQLEKKKFIDSVQNHF